MAGGRKGKRGGKKEGQKGGERAEGEKERGGRVGRK